MISYQSIAQECASFYADVPIAAGVPCKMSQNDSIVSAVKNDAFIGVTVGQRDNMVTVAVRGFVTVRYSGNAPAVGRTGLCTGDNGTVTASTSGQVYLVVNADTVKKTVTFLL